MANVVNVRLMVPRDEDGIKDGFVGHYDMQIEGAVSFCNRNFNNPVFSYRAEGDGYLDVFDGDKSSIIYGVNDSTNNTYKFCDIFKWSTVASASDISNFKTEMNKAIDSETIMNHPKGYGMRCRLKAGNPFQKYIFNYYNCFHAVSIWMKWLGEVRFLNIHKAKHDAATAQYSATRMMNKYQGTEYWKSM